MKKKQVVSFCDAEEGKTTKAYEERPSIEVDGVVSFGCDQGRNIDRRGNETIHRSILRM